MYKRPDVLFEIVKSAKEDGILVVRSPYEADWQLVSLMDQGIVDFIITDDCDIPVLVILTTFDASSCDKNGIIRPF